MDLQLKDKVALITGGSRGIGQRIAEAFAREGCHVGICGRDAAALDDTRAKLQALGVRVAAMQGDVCNPQEGDRFIAQAAGELGGVDILVNNVGTAEGGFLMDATDAQAKATFEGNVFAAVRMTKGVVPHMRKRGGGSIVNIASISGWHPQLAAFWQYGASKAAQIFMTKVIALQLSRDNIRVNVVSPGSIIWEGNSWDEFRKKHPESFAAYVRDGFPMGRLGHPEEVADAVVFIASPRAHWVNGRHIPVDGLEQPVPIREYRGW